MPDEIDHEYTDEIVCPWCGQKVSDSWEYQRDDGEMECCECDRKFRYSRNVSVTYTTRKIEVQE